MRKPIRKFAEGESVSVRFLYLEAAAGRLRLTKVGSRTFVDDVDGEAWRALAPKFNGKAGDRILQVAVKNLKELGKAVAEGLIDRAHASARLAETVRSVGLVNETAQTGGFPAAP